MAKRGFESRFLEYCEGEPVEAVQMLLRLGRSVLSKRMKPKKSKSLFQTAAEICAEVPEHPDLDDTLFERDDKGEVIAPF